MNHRADALLKDVHCFAVDTRAVAPFHPVGMVVDQLGISWEVLGKYLPVRIVAGDGDHLVNCGVDLL